MDAKLNPISSSTAGVPLSVESSTTQAKQANTNSDLNSSVIQDTLETTDREGDGRLPENTAAKHNSNSDKQSEPPEISTEAGQGSLLDLQG